MGFLDCVFRFHGLRPLRRRICTTSHVLLCLGAKIVTHTRRPMLAVSRRFSGWRVSKPWVPGL
eukprot:11156004-Lingulodinium_polyedra.AAC.1